MSTLDDLERKFRSLKRVVVAQSVGTNGVFLSYDPRGKTPEGREEVLNEILAEKGLEPGDLEAAGIPVRFANLWFCEGRNVGVTSKAQANAFLAGTWTPYSGKEPPEPETNTESVVPKPRPDAGSGAGAAFEVEEGRSAE